MDATTSAELTPVPATTLVIQPTRGWSRLGLGELWRYRGLLWFLTSRDIKGRYRQMALGPLWILIKPLVDMVVFTVIFGGLAKLPSEGVPYPIFTFTAILPWTYFATAASGSAGSLVSRMGIISKVYFPRLIVPVSATIVGLADFLVSFVILLAMLAFWGIRPGVEIFLLPFYLALCMVTALAIGLWSAALAVRFRDLQYAVGYAIKVGMYATPVAYSATLVPERWQFLYQMNPMYWVVEGFRWTLLGSGHGPQPLMWIPVALTFVLLISGAFIFRRSERNIVDLL